MKVRSLNSDLKSFSDIGHNKDGFDFSNHLPELSVYVKEKEVSGKLTFQN